MDARRCKSTSRDRYRPVIYLDEQAVSTEDMSAALAGIASAGPDGPNRYLLHLHSDEPVAAVATLISAGLPVQVFADDQAAIAMPGAIQFPPGSTPLDVETFGLAMSDAVVAATLAAETTLASRARIIGKPVVTPEMLSLPLDQLLNAEGESEIQEVRISLRSLDPDFATGLRGQILRHCGRLDSVLLDLMAGTYKLLSRRAFPPTSKTPGEHFSGVFGVMRNWSSGSKFVPQWEAHYPSVALPIHSSMIETFDWLDRAATAGARLYRDMVWLIHAFAFLAVFSAVFGAVVQIALVPAVLSPLIEGGSLLLVVILYSKARKLHTRWAACRVGAEQLRVARMSLPLLVVPPALLGVDRDPDAEDPSQSGEAIIGREKAVVLALVKRELRKQGPSAIRQPPSVKQAAVWLKHVITDQFKYHDRNHDKLETVERFETCFNIAVFTTVTLAVMYEVAGCGTELSEHSLLLLLTAGGPAAVSALHGATVRMEIRRRAELSRLYADKLRLIIAQLDNIIKQPDQSNWTAIRELITRASNAMGSEAEDWHSAVLLAPVALP